MKKNININLFGTLYAIDEDAYEMLNSYLSSMKQYYSRRPESSEVPDDIEHRVAELLWEKREAGAAAIDIDTVRQIINTIGKPDEMSGDAGASAAQSNTSNFAQASSANIYNERPRRSLYRDTDHKVLGGVCAGLAQYTNSDDPILWRIVFLLICLFVAPIMLIVYVVMWLIVPEPRTAEDYLRMTGRPVTPENLREQILTPPEYNAPKNNGCASGCLWTILIILGLLALMAMIFPFLVVFLHII